MQRKFLQKFYTYFCFVKRFNSTSVFQQEFNHWKKLDKLLKLKYVGFRWVRAHRNHPENNLCDFFCKAKNQGMNAANSG